MSGTLRVLCLFVAAAAAATLPAGQAQTTQPTEADAYATVKNMMRMPSFLWEIIDEYNTRGLTTCTARSNTFTSQCASTTTCQTGSGGDAPNSVCCDDGNKRCKRDSSGEEYSRVGFMSAWHCCDACAADPPTDSACTTTPSARYKNISLGRFPAPDGFASLCASVGATCKTCNNLKPGEYKSEQDECTRNGKCVRDDTGAVITSICSDCQSQCNGICSDGSQDQNSCTSGGNTWVSTTWVSGAWETVTASNVGTAQTCEAAGVGRFCYTCSGTTTGADYQTCVQSGTCAATSNSPQGNNCASATSEGSCDTTGSNACAWTQHTVLDISDQFTDGDSCENGNAVCQKCSDGDSSRSSSSDCTSKGVCSGGSYTSQHDCTNQGNCMNGNTVVSTDVSQGDCNGECTNSVHTDQISCSNSGGTWTSYTWTGYTYTANTVVNVTSYTTEGTCTSQAGHWWRKSNWWASKWTWDYGTRFGGPPMANYNADGTCMQGMTCTTCNEDIPTGQFTIHGAPGSLLTHMGFESGSDWIEDSTLLTDVAAGTTGSAAYAAAASYYDNLCKWVFATNARVATVDRTGATTQDLVLANPGVALLMYPENTGAITTASCGTTNQPACPSGTTAATQHVMVLEPINYASQQSISVPVGKFTVAGGSNAGTISMTTTGAVRLSGINNTGTVSFANSQDIYIAGVENTGSITFTDTKTAFVDVVNEASGTVTINGGTYTAYGIINRGTITIKTGSTISGHIRCNNGGTIVIETGVTGSGTIGGGDCAGTISGAGASSIVVDDQAEHVLRASFSMAGSGVTAAVVNTDAGVKQIKSDLATQLGVTPPWINIVSITDSGGRRRRRLLSTGIKVDYEVVVSDDTLKTTAENKMNEMRTSPTTSPVMQSLVQSVALQAGVSASSITPTAEAVVASTSTASQTVGGTGTGTGTGSGNNINDSAGQSTQLNIVAATMTAVAALVAAF